MSSPLIRPLGSDEIERLIEWAADEGWNPGIHDGQAFRIVDPDGFLGAFVDGVLVSGIAAVRYSASFGFIGLYICRPDQRGKGYGRAIWDAGMAYLDGLTIGLDGVPAQQANYRSMGFVRAYDTVRYSGLFPASAPAGIEIVPYAPQLGEAIRTLDRAAFPAARSAFLDRWIDLSAATCVALRDGQVVGFAVARRCRSGYKIGPLFANAVDVAEGLLSAIAVHCPDEMHLDVPADQVAFVASLERAGLTPGFTTARMYRGPEPSIAMDKVFAVTSLELG